MLIRQGDAETEGSRRESHYKHEWTNSVTHLQFDVLVSYRHQRGAELARLLGNALAHRGCRTFVDVRGLPGGLFDILTCIKPRRLARHTQMGNLR